MLPVFPTSTVPNNITFKQLNLLEGLPFEDNTFDFIHMQFLACDFTELQWETIVYKELARVLKPGGWLEICDPEFEFYNSGPTAKQINSAGKKEIIKSQSHFPLSHFFNKTFFFIEIF
jgi:ubiquinone/menaquinone biosynthesis C-methylase UbiE